MRTDSLDVPPTLAANNHRNDEMNKNDERVLIAVSGIEQLEQMHESFMNFVHGLSTVKPTAGTVSVSNNNLVVNCLGIPLTVKRKIVVKDGLPALVEYAFTYPKKDTDIVVFATYLGGSGVLFTDPNGGNRLCDYNNTYLANNLLNAIAINLLDSEVFEPSTNV